MQLAVAGKRRKTVVDLQKRVINCTWLRVSIFDWLIIMIGRICSSSYIGGVAEKKQLNLDI